MKYLSIILLFLINHLGNAQADASVATVAGLGSGSNTTAMSSIITKSITSNQGNKLNNSFGNAKGSPYLTDTFMPTKLFYDTEFIKNIEYRYNAYNQEIEIKQNSDQTTNNIYALSKDKKIFILVDGHKMSFKTFITSKKKTLNGYLTELIDGKIYDLYKREHIIFSLGRQSTNSFVKAVPSRFTKFTEYYFQKKGVNRMDEIPPNNRHFLKLLDDTSIRNETKAFLKDNKLNVKNEADIIKVIEELNKK